MNIPDERCQVVFVKYPEKGQVKVRLSQDIGKLAAVELYKNFILDLLEILNNLAIPLWICFYPNDAQEKLSHWLGTQYHYIPQNGHNLGERMKNAFIQAFSSGFKKVILIGSDIPDLPKDFINEAFLSLSTHDAVIGPAFDGGYYLIGFRHDKFIPEAFEGLTWSTDTVLEKTITIFKQKDLTIHLLPKWSDIDTVLNLKDLVLRHQNTTFQHSKTISYLLKHETIKVKLEHRHRTTPFGKSVKSH
jgi:rSAM/selenodomain-associated transferase 1